jgi:hypothetical protein
MTRGNVRCTARVLEAQPVADMFQLHTLNVLRDPHPTAD